MPISPYYKRLYEEDMPNPSPYSLGMTRTQQPQRNSLGITNVGPNLGVELPEFPEPSIEQPEPSQFQINRQRILPRGDDFDVPEEPELTPFQLNRSRIIPQGDDIDTGTPEIPDMGEPVTPEMTPAPRMPKLGELDTSIEAVSDPQRRRSLYTALAQFSAGMGNISGKPTETTVPSYFQDLTTQEGQQQENLLKRAQAQYRVQQQQYEAELRNKKKDPNSRESMVAREAVNSYAAKFGIQPVPDTATAEDIERQMPIIRDVIRAETSKINKLDELGLSSRLKAEEEQRQRDWEERQKEAGASQQLKVLEKNQAQQTKLKEMEIAAQREANELNRQGRLEEAKIKAQEAEQARAAQREFTASQANAARQFQASQANQAREFQRGMKEAEIGARRQETKQKLAEEERGLVVPGYELTGQVKPTAKEASDLRSAVATRDSFMKKLQRYKGLVNMYGTYENTISSPAGDQMASLATQMQLDLKNIAELGALSGPDMGLMIDLLPNPNSLASMFKSKAGLLQKLNQLEREAKDRVESGMASKGYRRVGSASQETQQPVSPSGRRVVRP